MSDAAISGGENFLTEPDCLLSESCISSVPLCAAETACTTSVSHSSVSHTSYDDVNAQTSHSVSTRFTMSSKLITGSSRSLSTESNDVPFTNSSLNTPSQPSRAPRTDDTYRNSISSVKVNFEFSWK